MPQPVGIGVEISEDQIRVARLRRAAHGVMVQGLGAAPTPEGAMSGASVLDTKLLADGIRRALRTAGVSAGLASVGLPGRAAASRLLELPAMAKDEMKTVVAGEMEHYRMIPMDQGTFDFLPLSEPGEDARRVRVLVMAADKKTVDNYREALRLAGLQLFALEPTSLAAARAVFPALAHGGVGFVTVGARSTELSVFCDGALRYSRQIDVGTLDIVGHAPEGVLNAAEATPTLAAPIAGIPTLERSGGDLQTLLFELQRSLDFYHREAPDAARVGRLLLAVDGTKVQGLDGHLQTGLELPVTVCDPFADLDHGAIPVDPVGAAAFAPALGLARRALGTTPEAPLVDLSFTGRGSRLAKSAPRWMTWATGLSLVLVLGAIVAFLQVSANLRNREEDLRKAKAELSRVSAEEQERTRAAQRVQEAQAIVQLRGLPWSDILFHVSSSMPEGVWLTSVQVQSGGTLALEGRALSPNSVAVLMEALVQSPLFRNPQLASMSKDNLVRGGTVVRYVVRAQLTPPAQAKARAGAPPGAASPGAVTTSRTVGGAR